MFDMSDPVGPSKKPPHPEKIQQGKIHKKTPDYREKTAQHHEKETQNVLGMNCTPAQAKKIYANLSNSILQGIREDQKRQKKAAQRLKNSFEGKPLDS